MIWQRGDQESAFACFERALAAVEPLPITDRKAYIVGQLARFNGLAGRTSQSFALAEEAIAMAEQLGDDQLLGDVLNTRGVARSALGDDDGIADLERSLELLSAIGSSYQLLRAYINLSSTLSDIRGDLERAEELAREGLTLAERMEQHLNVRWLRGNLADGEYLVGRWDECLRRGDLEIADPTPHYMQSNCRLRRALIRLARGDTEGGVADLNVALAQARRIRDPQALWPALATAALGHALLGDRSGGRSALDELNDLRGTHEHSTKAGEVAVLEALAALDLGRVSPGRAAATVQPTPWDEAGTAIASGDLGTAANVLARIGAKAYEAHVRLRLAQRLHAAGRPGEATGHLAATLAFYRGVGASAMVREAELLLPATG